MWYNDPSTGVDLNYIPREPLEGELLIQVLGMDRIDINGQPQPDGVYDFVDNAATMGGTMNSQNGRVFLPSVEPFGKTLRDQILDRVTDPDQAESLIQTIVFQPLYDSTKTAAQQIPSLNRFRIKGQYQSQISSEIMLNALNIPEGSVTVTSGRGAPHREPRLHRGLQPGSGAHHQRRSAREWTAHPGLAGEQQPVQHPDQDVLGNPVRLCPERGPGLGCDVPEPPGAPADAEGEHRR